VSKSDFVAEMEAEIAHAPLDALPRLAGMLESLRVRIGLRLLAPPAADAVLTAKDAAKLLGVSEDMLRRRWDAWDDELRAATGEGFAIVYGEGTVRYSAAGCEALKAYWRRKKR
jgi:hypothetical protein